MLRLAAGAGLIAATLLGLPAAATTVVTPLDVTLAVPDTCRVEVPQEVQSDGSGNVRLTVDSILSDCSALKVPAILTIERDFSHGGIYVATINF